jgi:hypothetical protein
MSEAILNEIYEEIQKTNAQVNAKAIPHSDEFISYVAASIAITPQKVKNILSVLNDSHKIFTIEIVSEDALRAIPRIEGYVVTELDLVRKMKAYFQKELVYMYNTQFNKDLMVHQAIRELFPVIKSYNNTPLGEVANKAIMLEELEKLMEVNFEEYTEEWKEQQLEIAMGSANLEKTEPSRKKEKDKAAEEPPAAAAVAEKPQIKMSRAVDTKKYRNLISMSKSKKYPLQRILNIYGVKFFIRTYLRRYEFSYLRQLVEDRQINKRSDLQLLKDMLRTMKSNIDSDPNLATYKDDIYELERIVSHYMYFSDRA